LSFKVYRRRWYILALFSWFSAMQCLVWITWSPIANNAKKVFGWNDDTIALLVNWGPILFLPVSPLSAWIVDTKGLRAAVLLGTGLTFGGAALRLLLPFERLKSDGALWSVHVGHMLNAAAGPVAMGAVVKLSQEWFPPQERTLSTAIGGCANNLGMAAGFLLGPLLVQHASFPEIENLLWVHAALTGPTFLLALLYFPSQPPTPPSATASEPRDASDFWPDMRALMRHRPFWLLVIPYGITAGVYNGWSALLEVNMDNLGLSQNVAGVMGFSATLAGVVGGVILGALVDRLRRMKLFMLVLFGAAAVFFFWFALACEGYLPDSELMLITLATMGGLFLTSTTPLFYELSVEVTHPIAQGTVGSVLTAGNNLGALLFLFVPLEALGTRWINWVQAGVCGGALLVLLFFPEDYVRFDQDQAKAEAAAEKQRSIQA
jgi:FLVCR family MFS transporter